MWFGDFSVFRLPHWIPGRFLGPFPPTYGYLEPQALACHRLRWDLCRMMLGCHDLYMTLSWLWKLWNHENGGSEAFKPWFVGGFPTITLPWSPYRDPWASLTTHAVVGAGPFIGHTSCDINVTCMGEREQFANRMVDTLRLTIVFPAMWWIMDLYWEIESTINNMFWVWKWNAYHSNNIYEPRHIQTCTPFPWTNPYDLGLGELILADIVRFYQPKWDICMYIYCVYIYMYTVYTYVGYGLANHNRS